MPNEALGQKADAISIIVRTILAKTLKSTHYDASNMQNFAKLIRSANDDNVLTPIDICTALHFIEVIFATIMAAKKTSNLSWIKSYSTQPAFDKIDTLLCTVALGLAVKYNQDVPFNTRSFWLLHGFNIDSNVTLTEFRERELSVLALLDFTLPRDPNRINHYAQSIFINPAETGPLSFSQQRANSATAFPYTYMLTKPDRDQKIYTTVTRATRYKNDANEEFNDKAFVDPKSAEDLLPAQYPASACYGNIEYPANQPSATVPAAAQVENSQAPANDAGPSCRGSRLE